MSLSCQLLVLHEGRSPNRCCIHSHGSFLGVLQHTCTAADRSSCKLLCISSFSLLLAFFPLASPLGLLDFQCLVLICGQTHILCIELTKKHHGHHRPWAETHPAPGSVAQSLVCFVGSPCRPSSALDTAFSSHGRRRYGECVLRGFAPALLLRPQPPCLHSKGPCP